MDNKRKYYICLSLGIFRLFTIKVQIFIWEWRKILFFSLRHKIARKEKEIIIIIIIWERCDFIIQMSKNSLCRPVGLKIIKIPLASHPKCWDNRHVIHATLYVSYYLIYVYLSAFSVRFCALFQEILKSNPLILIMTSHNTVLSVFT